MSVDRLQVNPGRFPFSPKFRKGRLEIKRKGQMEVKVVYFNRSYQSDRNVLFVVPSIVYCLREQCGGNWWISVKITHLLTIEQCTYLFCWCIHAQQSDFIMIWWISGLFLWWFLFYFGIGCVCIWRESNVRWPGSCLWNRTFNVSLGTWNFHILLNGKRPLNPLMFEGGWWCCRRLHFLRFGHVTL